GIDLANDALFSSQNGGKTWPTGTAQCHEGDRPWLAGAEENEVFLSTDTQEAGHVIYRSTDAGASCSSKGIPDNGTAPGGDSYTGTGKLQNDAKRNNLIEPLYYSRNNVVDGVGVGILRNASLSFKRASAHFAQV